MTEEGPHSEVVAQTRRRFMQALGSAGVAGAVGSARATADTEPTDVDENIDEVEGTVGALSFYSPASQLNTEKEPLADDDVALVRAEPPAFNFQTVDDGDDEPDAVEYPDDIDIPLVSQDTEKPVVGFGTVDFVRDTTGGFRNDNEMFMLNLFDELVGTDSLVAFDESHQIYQSLDDYQSFTAYAESEGYELRGSGDLLTSGLTVSSAASQINETGDGPLTDSDHVVVWAEPTAENVDNEGNDAVSYPGDTDIPLVSRDGPVFGFGTPELVDDEAITANNEQFLLNVLDDAVGGSGTVVWDDAHGTFWDSSKFSGFSDTLEAEGYEFTSSGDDILAGGEPELEFAATSSLINEDDEGGLLLTDDSRVAVWAEETATNFDISEPLVVDDDTAGAETTHGWLFDNVDFNGEVDTITVDYPDTASFDGLDETNIRVLLTRQLSDGLDMSNIDVNSGEYSGSTATFDLSGIFSTDIAGPVAVRIDGIANPDSTEYSATITFEGADDQVSLTASPARDDDGNPEGSPDTAPYPDSFDIPLLGVDESGGGPVLGVGADFASDANGQAANRTVLVNAWENTLGTTGTVLYDETHGQSRTLSEYSALESAAESRGFTVDSITSDFEGSLGGADAVMLASDDDDLTAFTQSERDALADFVANGGGLFVHDTSFVGGDSTPLLNEVLAAVGATVRFNRDQVVDEQNNVLGPSLPRTGNFNESDYPALFEGLEDQQGSIDLADVVAIPSPDESYTQAELDALAAHVDSGGAVFLFDQSDFNGFDKTGTLNDIADALNLAFRFNPDQVEDTENGLGFGALPFVPQTKNFNESFALFDGLDAVGLPDVDAVMITTPFFAFSDIELDALASFVDSGGAAFLFDQSDFGGQDNPDDGFDETANFNAIAEALGLDFRFNSDQVNDEVNNTGSVFDPLTANYDVDPENPGVFDERENGIGIEFDPEQEYYAQVREVIDGDTFIVEFDEQHTDYGYRDTVRHLGMDTAETGGGNDPFEWFGIPDDKTSHLDTWGQEAVDFALDIMAPEGAETEQEIEGRSVKIRFDEAEPVRGGFGRLLSYMDYDPDSFDADPGSGSFDAEYNLETVSDGYARVYSSGFGRHDEFGAAEETALANGTGVWEAADFDALDPYRTAFVENAFLPRASSVTTADGPLDGGDDAEDDSGPTSVVRASESATQEPLDDGGYDQYEDAPPLAAVDAEGGVAMFSGQLLEESYEAGEDDDITDQFDLGEAGNFTLFTNTVEALSGNDGPILIEGGHGQFGVDGGATLEDLKFYLRHVEGLSGQIDGNARLRQINNVKNNLPDDARALVLTTPGEGYSQDELAAIEAFRDAGGAVVLVGSAAPEAGERANLNEVAETLGTTLRLNSDRILDEGGPVDDPQLLVTDNVEGADGLRVPVHLDREFDGTGVMAVLDNVGNEAWSLAAATDGVGLTDGDNPMLTFKVGDRHHIENRAGADVYPLALYDEDGEPLLTQDGEGSFEDDENVNWVDTGDIVEFTLTESLAEELDEYSCPVAPSMEGDVVTSERLGGPPQIAPRFDGPPQDLTNNGLYEDVNGDGEFDIFDVQALFETYESETVQNHAEFFDFNDDGVINIFDVQALFVRL